MACIDASPSALAVCDYAAWASVRLQAPLLFLHVLDRAQYPVAGDLSGNIGLGSREHLLEELAALDEQRGKLAREQGKLMLQAARERAQAEGVAEPQMKQRHGDLVEAVAELEGDIRLLVMGKQGEHEESQRQHVGSHLENVIRTLHRPILVTTGEFKAPKRILLAFDGSATTRKGVDMIAASPLFHGLPVHLLMVGALTADARAQLDAAGRVLEGAGFAVHAAIRAGEVEAVIARYVAEQAIDLLVMGAYGHSRIRQFLVGSTTTRILHSLSLPLLLLR